MWSGPVGLGAIRTRIVGSEGDIAGSLARGSALPRRRAGSPRGGGVSGRRASASGHLVEQTRGGVARQDLDERRGAESERGPAAGTLEGQRVEGLGAGKDRDRRTRRQCAGLEV